MSSPKLYTWNQSGNCYKVRLLASLLSINLEHVEVDYPAKQQSTPEFLAINPRGQIPVLTSNGKTFTDSGAILVYLAGTYPDPNTAKTPSSYWSIDASEQAEIVDWLTFAAWWISPGIAQARVITRFPQNWKGATGTDQQAADALAKAREKGHRSLEILETKLKGSEWLACGRPSIADIAVFPYVALSHLGGVELEEYPSVKSWIERIRGLERFIPMVGQLEKYGD
jgi:glutathione S-transferase